MFQDQREIHAPKCKVRYDFNSTARIPTLHGWRIGLGERVGNQSQESDNNQKELENRCSNLETNGGYVPRRKRKLIVLDYSNGWHTTGHEQCSVL